MRVLLVKMSSLGDVVHALPGISDAVRALGPEVTFDWVVEEAFSAIPARHPAVAEVVPIAWRRWRGQVLTDRRELGAFVTRLRQCRYDLVLDAQGLVKSALVTALARAPVKAGLALGSAREGAAASFYGRRVVVPRQQHAVDRIRALFAGALGYPVPDTPVDFGITPPRRDSGRRCVLLHGTTWNSKHWPEPFWYEVARRAAAAGFEVVLPWGDELERRRAETVARQAPARVLETLSLTDLMDELSGAALIVGVDSGLAHLGAALGVPTVVAYGSTSCALTGCRGQRVRNLQAEFPCSPCLARECGYSGPQQYWQDVAVRPACYATVSPERVWQAATELTHADRILHI